MDMGCQLAIDLQALRQLCPRPVEVGLCVEVGQHLVALDFAVKVSAVFGEVVIRPLLEVLAYGGHLLASFDTRHRRHDATFLGWQGEVELHALHHEGNVRLPVGFGVVSSHEVAAEVVAYGARLSIVVLLGLHKVVVAEDQRPHAPLRTWVVTAQHIVGGESKLGSLGKRDEPRMVALFLIAEVTSDFSEEIVEVEVLVALANDLQIVSRLS